MHHAKSEGWYKCSKLNIQNGKRKGEFGFTKSKKVLEIKTNFREETQKLFLLMISPKFQDTSSASRYYTNTARSNYQITLEATIITDTYSTFKDFNVLENFWHFSVAYKGQVFIHMLTLIFFWLMSDEKRLSLHHSTYTQGLIF